MTLHESFCKILASLEHCTRLRRTNNWYRRCAFIVLEVIVYTFYERIFRAYDHHIYAFLYAECLQRFEIVCLYGYVFACICRSGVTRSDVKFITFAALSNLPCKGVFPSSTS